MAEYKLNYERNQSISVEFTMSAWSGFIVTIGCRLADLRSPH